MPEGLRLRALLPGGDRLAEIPAPVGPSPSSPLRPHGDTVGHVVRGRREHGAPSIGRLDNLRVHGGSGFQSISARSAWGAADRRRGPLPAATGAGRLAAEPFCPDSGGMTLGASLPTGDLVRLRADGALAYPLPLRRPVTGRVLPHRDRRFLYLLGRHSGARGLVAVLMAARAYVGPREEESRARAAADRPVAGLYDDTIDRAPPATVRKIVLHILAGTATHGRAIPAGGFRFGGSTSARHPRSRSPARAGARCCSASSFPLAPKTERYHGSTSALPRDSSHPPPPSVRGWITLARPALRCWSRVARAFDLSASTRGQYFPTGTNCPRARRRRVTASRRPGAALVSPETFALPLLEPSRSIGSGPAAPSLHAPSAQARPAAGGTRRLVSIVFLRGPPNRLPEIRPGRPRQ